MKDNEEGASGESNGGDQCPGGITKDFHSDNSDNDDDRDTNGCEEYDFTNEPDNPFPKVESKEQLDNEVPLFPF